jgi:hypothetical protein
MSFNGGFWPIFLRLLELDLHTTVAFFKSRALQPCFPSVSAESKGHVGCRYPAHGLHAPESLLLFGTCSGHAPPFLAVHGGHGVYGGQSTVGWC